MSKVVRGQGATKESVKARMLAVLAPTGRVGDVAVQLRGEHVCVIDIADLDAVRRSYDAVADRYVELLLDQGMGDVRRQPWLRGMLDAFADEVRELGPVLDVGCGPGQVTAYLAERGLEVSGVDLSPSMIGHARRLYPQCRFEVRSATDLNLEPCSYGGILGWWSLFNLPRTVLPEVLCAFREGLVPGGRVIVATHAGEGEVRRDEAYGGVPVTWTTYRWEAEALGDLMTSVGLTSVATLRLSAGADHGPAIVLVGERSG